MGKLAIGGVIGGLMLAIAIGSALHPPIPPADTAAASAATEEGATPIPPRCRVITMPDSGCDAAWDARRRHFFGQGQTQEQGR